MERLRLQSQSAAAIGDSLTGSAPETAG